MENTMITFSESLKEQFVKDILGKNLDDEGYIEDLSGERVLSPSGSEVHINQFVGFENGSEIFIKGDVPSLMKYLKTHK